MKNVKSTRYVYGLVLALFVLMAGIQANAAKALNQAFAVMAGSVLLDKNTISYTAVLPELPASDDGAVYLYELQPFFCINGMKIIVQDLAVAADEGVLSDIDPLPGINRRPGDPDAVADLDDGSRRPGHDDGPAVKADQVA